MASTLSRMSTRVLQEVPSVIMISMLDENIISDCHELIDNLITTGLNGMNNTLSMHFFVEEDSMSAIDEMMTFYDSSDLIMNIVSTEIDTLLEHYSGRIVKDVDIVNTIHSKLRKNFKLDIHVENSHYCDRIHIHFCPESIVS